jgi:hypothetical protein
MGHQGGQPAQARADKVLPLLSMAMAVVAGVAGVAISLMLVLVD